VPETSTRKRSTNPLSPKSRQLTGGTATAGTDYTSVSKTLTFADGETEKTIPLPVANDGVTEPEETVGLTLSGMRRNPDDPQYTDFRGWEFWLNKLNQFNGNFIDAEMVKAFITSGEYCDRFGK